MVNVCYSGNAKMFDGFLISLLSMVRHTKETVHAIILTGDFSSLNPAYVPFNEEQRAFIENTLRLYNKENSVRLIDITPLIEQEFKKCANLKTRFSPYTLLRLFLDQIEDIPDRLLYIDADTIVMKDIKELYDFKMGDCFLAAARDAVGRKWVNVDYCNAGVLLLDMGKIRKTNLFALCRKRVETRFMFMPDQTAINVYFEGRKAFLPCKFNEQVSVKEHTVIRHYCSVMKLWPWLHIINVKQWEVDKMHEVLNDHYSDDILNDYLTLKDQFVKQEQPRI